MSYGKEEMLGFEYIIGENMSEMEELVQEKFVNTDFTLAIFFSFYLDL